MNLKILLNRFSLMITFLAIIGILVVTVEGIAINDSKPHKEWREQKGNDVLIINDSGHYVEIVNPETGTRQLLNVSRSKDYQPAGTAITSLLPPRTTWPYPSQRESAVNQPEASPMASPVIQATPIDLSNKVIITQPGVYEIISNYSGSDDCAIDIQSSDVVLIGNGHLISGQNSAIAFNFGIKVNKVSNVTISGVNISSWDYGIEINEAMNCTIRDSQIFDNVFSGIGTQTGVYNKPDNTVIENNLIYRNVYSGISLFGTDDSIVRFNYIANNRDIGIDTFGARNNSIISNYIIINKYGIETGDSDNTFINNYFINNEKNFYNRTVGGNNRFNLTVPLSGEVNIIGGNLVGGNYWALSDNTGFSQITNDNNDDGICDGTYTLYANNQDSFPLAPGKSNTILTLDVPETVYCNKNFLLNGRLTDTSGNGIASQLIFYDFGTSELFGAVTDSQGYHEASTSLPRGFRNVTAAFPGWATLKPSLSIKKRVNIVSQGNPIQISLNAPDTVQSGQKYLVYGYARSDGEGISVYLTPEASWDNVTWNRIFYGYPAFTSNLSGYFIWSETYYTSSGNHRYLRVRHDADCYYPSESSPIKIITFTGNTKIGVFRPSTHIFYLKNGTTTTSISWGAITDLPVTGDWNGDGRTEVGVFRNSTHTFYLKNGTSTTTINWGTSTDTPVTGDWNGDRRTDVGVFRNSTHMFYLKNGTTTTSVNWGLSTDTPVTGDWNGDGRTEVGVFRNPTHTFYLKNGTTTTAINWGTITDLPVTGDWNGDGRTEVGVFRNSTHTFYLKNGTTTTAINWGVGTDKPVTGKW